MAWPVRPCRTTGSCGRRVGLQRYSEDEIIRKLAAAGFSASRARSNIGHNPWRMTFVARHAFVRGAQPSG